MGVNLIGLRSLPGPPGLLVFGYVLRDLLVVRDVGQLLLVRT